MKQAPWGSLQPPGLGLVGRGWRIAPVAASHRPLSSNPEWNGIGVVRRRERRVGGRTAFLGKGAVRPFAIGGGA